MKKLIFCFGILITLTCTAYAQTVIAAKDASKHIGDSVTITAKIFSGKAFATNMVLLDVGGYNPNQELTLMIPPTIKEKFKGQPDVDYKGKDVTVTGKLIEFKGKPEIILYDPKQIKVVMSDNIVPVKAKF